MGAGVTLRASVALLESWPLVAENSREKAPVCAETGMENLTSAVFPTGTRKGEAGEELAPEGSPEIATVTVPVKPF
jgi:hypothetical protein